MITMYGTHNVFPLINVLYSDVTAFRSKSAVPSVAVLLFMYFVNDFEIIPVVHIITGIILFLNSACIIFLLLDLHILIYFWDVS